MSKPPALTASLDALTTQLDRARASAGEDARELAALLDDADKEFERLTPMIAASAGTPDSEHVLKALHRARESQLALVDVLRMEVERLGRAIQALSAGSGAGSGYSVGSRPQDRRPVLDRVG